MDRGRSATGIGAAGAFCALALAAPAQDGGALARFEIGQSLRVTGDTDGTRGFAQTDLSFALSSQTRSQTIDLTIATGLQFGELDDSGDITSDISEPVFNLSYSRESRDAALRFGATYRSVDLGTARIVDATAADGVIDIDEGRRADSSVSLGLDFGRTAPFGGTLSLGQSRTDYSDTIDPDLRDSTTNNVSGVLNFRLGNRITTRLTGGYTDAQVAGDGIDRITRRIGTGATVLVNPRLTADVDLGYTEIEISDPDTGLRTEDGLRFSTGLTQEMPNGTLSGSLGSEVGETGRRTSVDIARALELKSGSLQVNAGFSQQDDFGLDPVLGFSYAHAMKRGEISARLSQAYVTDADGVAVRNTRGQLGIAQDVSRTMNVAASLAIADSDALPADATDAQRLDLSLSLNQTLTDDWDLTGGYTRSLSREDGAADITTDTIFVGLQRGFTWRP